MITSFRTSVHGRTIELPWALGLPEGHVIKVTVKTCPDVESPRELPPPRWLQHLEVNPAAVPGKLVVKGTRLDADTLLEFLDQGKSDADLLRAHPELSPDDVAAVREYAKMPLGLRRSFGAWAEDAEELDTFLEEIRRARKIPRQGIEE